MNFTDEEINIIRFLESKTNQTATIEELSDFSSATLSDLAERHLLKAHTHTMVRNVRYDIYSDRKISDECLIVDAYRLNSHALAEVNDYVTINKREDEKIAISQKSNKIAICAVVISALALITSIVAIVISLSS